MRERHEFPELLPPDAPHAQCCLVPGWWLVPVIVASVAVWLVIILLLF